MADLNYTGLFTCPLWEVQLENPFGLFHGCSAECKMKVEYFSLFFLKALLNFTYSWPINIFLVCPNMTKTVYFYISHLKLEIKHCLLPNRNSIFAREILGKFGRLIP